MDDLGGLLSAFANTNLNDRSELVKTFSSVMKTDESTAKFFLEAGNFNVETAINSYLSTVGSEVGLAQQRGGFDFQPPTGILSVELEKTELRPGEHTKARFSFQNCGTAPWPEEARIYLKEGDSLGLPREMRVGAVPVTREPYTRVMNIRAPLQVGSFGTSWRLHCRMGFFDMQAAWVFITVSGEAVDGGAEHMGMQTGLQGERVGVMQGTMLGGQATWGGVGDASGGNGAGAAAAAAAPGAGYPPSMTMASGLAGAGFMGAGASAGGALGAATAAAAVNVAAGGAAAGDATTAAFAFRAPTFSAGATNGLGGTGGASGGGSSGGGGGGGDVNMDDL